MRDYNLWVAERSIHKRKSFKIAFHSLAEIKKAKKIYPRVILSMTPRLRTKIFTLKMTEKDLRPPCVIRWIVTMSRNFVIYRIYTCEFSFLLSAANSKYTARIIYVSYDNAHICLLYINGKLNDPVHSIWR